MSPADAARVLDLPPDATPEQIEARFLEARARLEDKIAKALTPGLAAKYREALAGIEDARTSLLARAGGGPTSVSPVEAARRLELPTHATPEQIAERAEEMRRKLEDKLAKAPTPGLKAKYREALVAVEQAQATLLSSVDGASLPVLRRGSAVVPPDVAPPAPFPARSVPEPEAAPRAPRRWVRPVGIGVLVLALGALGLIALRHQETETVRLANVAAAEVEAARQAELSRQAAAAERARRTEEEQRVAEAERLAAEAQRLANEERARVVATAEAERQRQAAIATQLRQQLADAQSAWNDVEEVQRRLARELGALRSEVQAGIATTPGQRAERTTALSAMGDADTWLRDFLASHPAQGHRQRAEELLALGRLDEAAVEIASLQRAQATLREEVARETERRLTITGTVALETTPPALAWEITDAFGHRHEGVTPASAKKIAIGPAEVVFRRPLWPDLRRNIVVRREEQATATASFLPGSVSISSTPTGATVRHNGTPLGTTPLRLSELAPANYDYQLELDGHLPATVSGRVSESQNLELSATLRRRITEADYPVVHFFRTRMFNGSAMTLKLALENQPIGELRNGTYLTVRVPPGRYRLHLQTWLNNSGALPVTFEPNRTHFVQVRLLTLNDREYSTQDGLGITVHAEETAKPEMTKLSGSATPQLLQVSPEVPYQPQ